MRDVTRTHPILGQGVLAVLLALALVPERCAGGDHAAPLVRSHIEGTDAVLEGAVEEIARAPGGVWHRFRASSVLRGDGAPGEVVHLFTHGAGMPESVELVPGERTLVGVRWLTAGGPYAERLLRSVAERDPGARAGLVAPDGVFVLAGAGGTALLDQVRSLLAPGAHPAPAGAGAFAAAASASSAPAGLVALLGSDHPPVRVEVLRRLAASAPPLPGETVAQVRHGLRAELDGPADAAVLQGYVDLVRHHGVTGCHEALCEIAVGRDDLLLGEEAIDALARVEPGRSLQSLLVLYPAARPPARGRILRALARLQWPGSVHLIREALESPDAGLHSASIDALGECRSPESTALLEQIARHARPEFRLLAVDAIARQRTERSRLALRRLLAEPVGPRASWRRLTPAPRPDGGGEE
jgi:hypothetical protein